jgi:hypothetical protein
MYGHAVDQLPLYLGVCQDGLGVVPMSGTISSSRYGESRAVVMEREIKVIIGQQVRVLRRAWRDNVAILSSILCQQVL